MSNENSVRNLIRIEDKSNPTLYRALQLMIEDLYSIEKYLFPPDSNSSNASSSSSADLGVVTGVIVTAYPTNLRIAWDDLSNAFRYEIRLGDDWATAQPLVKTSANVVNLDPIELNLLVGDYTFLIRPIDIAGRYGDNITSTTFTVDPILPPELNLDVINNQVLLRWNVPTSTWKIDHYIIYKNSIENGRINGTFQILQELAGGSYDYSIAAVDIVGNVSEQSIIRTAVLQNPPDFEFVDSLSADYTGTFDATKKTVYNGITGIIGPVIEETWEEHFVDNSWSTPQDQVTAGYPKYFQPSGSAGYYEEIFDFGEILSDLTISVDYSRIQLVGTTTLAIQMSVSEDGITYTTPVVASSLFGVTFRYVKVRIDFTNTDDLALCFVFDLQVVLNVSLTMDSGNASADKDDVGGTLIEYSKTFSQVNSVTATPVVSVQPLYVVVEDVTETDFKVYVYDSAGHRVTADIAWKARGILF